METTPHPPLSPETGMAAQGSSPRRRQGVLLCTGGLQIQHASDRVEDLLGATVPRNGDGAVRVNLLDLLAPFGVGPTHPIVEVLHGNRRAARQEQSFRVSRPGEPKELLLRFYPLAGAEWMVVVDDPASPERGVQLPAGDPRDSLTGLLTRSVLEREVQLALERATLIRTCALLMIDLDRFKAVNDTLGHPVGDALLRTVAKRLKSAVRQGDLVARLGGDEFAILLNIDTVDKVQVRDIATRIIELVGRPYLIHGNQVDVGASIGIAVAPEHGEDWEALLKNADLALYRSKERGKGCAYFFEPAMADSARHRREMEMDLRKALAMRQFELYYQPQVALDSGLLLGFEALLRWQHPARGFISPAEFIPLAEQLGLIVAIGDWVLRTACEEAARWPGVLSVAVNVSPLQFDGSHLVQAVRDALTASSLDPSRLELEITEGVLLRYDDAALETLNALKTLGVQIAMDDFGTGYASLSQLASFPFDKIKIDQSFFRGVGESSPKHAIVRAIAGLGESMGFHTIAEGVETQEQLTRTRANGCGSVQGYFFSKPVATSEIGQLIVNLSSPGPRASSAQPIEEILSHA